MALNNNSKKQFDLGYLSEVNKDWTLFLDRDGVINKKIDNGYVRGYEQFEVLPGVLEALSHFSVLFGKVIVVTNQQGVGKGLMTAGDVEEIHERFLVNVNEIGGRIDAFYFAPQLQSENSNMRKPNIGMAMQAKKDFPDINFAKSIMIGDSITDMEFANRAGIKQFFLTDLEHRDYSCISSLKQLSQILYQIKV